MSDWQQLLNLREMLAFVVEHGGASDDVDAWDFYPLPGGEEYAAVRLADGTILLAAVEGSGPPYSEVTPDPQWPATVRYYWRAAPTGAQRATASTTGPITSVSGQAEE